MYAELNVLLKSTVNSNTLSNALKNKLGNSVISAQSAVAGTPLTGYVQQVVGAASFPGGAVVVYLHIAADEIMVYIRGKSIPQIKGQCEKALKQLKGTASVSVTEASARIMIPINGTDVDILTGAKFSWISAFWESLKEKSVSKVIPSALIAGLAIYHFVPSSPPIASGIIALVATVVGVLAEAALVSRSSESWKWKESK